MSDDVRLIHFYQTLTCQQRHSNVLTKPVRLCRQEQLIREEHSVSGHMCTREPVSQHTTGKHCGGMQAGRRLTSSRANMKPPRRHVMVSAPQAPGTLSWSPVCRGREGWKLQASQTAPQPVLSPRLEPLWDVCVCVLLPKLLLNALIGLSLMSKQTTTAAK